ncbi:helix-turn-helix domain-containing protein [Bacteroidota bacterium]
MNENQSSQHPKDLTLEAIVEQTSRSYIREVLNRKSGNVSAAAHALGLSRQGLYKKMKRLGIDWQE